MKPSKMVNDRSRSSQVVERTALLLGPQAAERLAPLLAAGLEPGEPPADLGQVTRLLGAALGRRRQALVDADKAHRRQLLHDFQWRERRERLVSELSGRVEQVRKALDATYGLGAAQSQTGISHAPPRDPVTLLAQADAVLEELRQPSRLASAAEPLPGIALDRPTWIERIETSRQELAETLGELVDVRRLTLSASATKDRALADYDAAFGQVSRLLEALFAVAGMRKEAAQVRPSARRPGRTEEDPEDPGDVVPPPGDSEVPDAGDVPGAAPAPGGEAPPVTGAPS